MKCPECGKECVKGIIEAKDAGSITQLMTVLSWYPEEEKNKLIRKNAVALRTQGEGWYCDECMKVFAAFSQKR